MVERKKPMGDKWTDFVLQWQNSDHAGKVKLAESYGVTYDTAKHHISEGRTDRVVSKKVVKPYFKTEEPCSNLPLRLNTGSNLVTFAIIGDTHHPYQDDKTLENVEKFLEEAQPDYLIYNGDINDFYQVSVFDKDPSRLDSLQKDLDISTEMFARHQRILPDTTKFFIEGTHEHRWFKYLRQCAPALAKLDGTNVTELYKLEKFGITYVPFERGILINEIFLVLHGDMVSIHSSYTAKRQYEKNGGCGMCNHTHRGGSYYKRDRFGIWGWWENFCLCSLNPDWIQNPDWTQGFSLVHFSGDRFWVEQIPIVDSSFIYGGKVYGKNDNMRLVKKEEARTSSKGEYARAVDCKHA